MADAKESHRLNWNVDRPRSPAHDSRIAKTGLWDSVAASVYRDEPYDDPCRPVTRIADATPDTAELHVPSRWGTWCRLVNLRLSSLITASLRPPPWPASTCGTRSGWHHPDQACQRYDLRWSTRGPYARDGSLAL